MQQQVEWLGKPCLLTSEQQKKGGSMGIWKGGREKKRGDILREKEIFSGGLLASF